MFIMLNAVFVNFKGIIGEKCQEYNWKQDNILDLFRRSPQTIHMLEKARDIKLAKKHPLQMVGHHAIQCTLLKKPQENYTKEFFAYIKPKFSKYIRHSSGKSGLGRNSRSRRLHLLGM